VTDPTPGNPLCAAVSRSPTTGFILDAFVDDRNLASINQQGVDLDFSWRFNMGDSFLVDNITLAYQASIVTDYSIQRNAVLTPVDCQGRYGARCSSDLVTLVAPDYRHRATLTFEREELTVQFGWKRIGEIADSTVGSTGVIPAYDYFDFNLALRPPVEGLTLTFGIDNIFAKAPPRPVNPGAFNTFPDTYDVLGRTFGFTATMRF
jgi:iron complex outermembrane recepter protein